MSTATEAAPSKSMLWAGRALSALPVALFVASALGKLSHTPDVVAGLTGKYGYPQASIAVIGTIELLSAAIYAVPLTSVLGAVLLTGYLGGAVATHVRAGEPFFLPLGVAIVVWAGLFLRDERIRALLPINRA
jgi:hypothetical protein